MEDTLSYLSFLKIWNVIFKRLWFELYYLFISVLFDELANRVLFLACRSYTLPRNLFVESQDRFRANKCIIP